VKASFHTNLMINFFIAALVLASLIGAIWYWGRDNLLKDQNKDKAKDARDDADIANEPSKRGSSLLDSLFRRNK
jgi:archaellum component FlaG (FlaF/FlaG flagellin family)